jgi:hypothetical protein
MFTAPGMWPGTWACSCGRCSGGEPLAAELLRRPDIDVLLLAELGEHLVAQRPQLAPDESRDAEVGGWEGGNGLRQLAPVELPAFAPAVQQLDGVEAQIAAEPVRVRGEPVVVAAVEHHGRIRADTGLLEQAAQPVLVDVVAAQGIVQVGGPVPADSIADVPHLVGAGVLVDVDDADVRIIEVFDDPRSVDECLGAGEVTHRDLPGCSC